MIWVPIKVVMETFYRLYTYPLSYDLCSNISGDIGILAATHLLTELQSGLQYKSDWYILAQTHLPIELWYGFQYKWSWRHFIAYTHNPLSYDLGSNISRDRDILVSRHLLTELPSGLQYK